MWFSACELGVLLATGDNCVKTEAITKVFSGKGIAMMHECKRLLNHSTAAEGFLLARSSTQRTKTTSMDALLVPQPTDSDADADSDATKHATEHHEDGAATEHAQDDDATEKAGDGDATQQARGDLSAVITEPPTKKQRSQSRLVSKEQPGDATKHADYSEDDCDEPLPPVMTSIDAATTVADATGKKQMFTKSLAHRDDWLHRGIMLRDMDYYHYSRYVERVEMPRSGSAQGFQKSHGV